MKIFLDDIREAPQGWDKFETVEAVKHYISNGYPITHISLDHDLGDNVPTGYDLCKWIEEQVYRCNYKPPILTIHSANPVGRKNMQAAIDSISRKV